MPGLWSSVTSSVKYRNGNGLSFESLSAPKWKTIYRFYICIPLLVLWLWIKTIYKGHKKYAKLGYVIFYFEKAGLNED